MDSRSATDRGLSHTIQELLFSLKHSLLKQNLNEEKKTQKHDGKLAADCQDGFSG